MIMFFFMFFWPCIVNWLYNNYQLWCTDYYLFIKYYSPLHVSSIKCSSSGGYSCTHAANGTITLYESSWCPVGTQLEWELTEGGRLLVGVLRHPPTTLTNNIYVECIIYINSACSSAYIQPLTRRLQNVVQRILFSYLSLWRSNFSHIKDRKYAQLPNIKFTSLQRIPRTDTCTPNVTLTCALVQYLNLSQTELIWIIYTNLAATSKKTHCIPCEGWLTHFR